MFNLFRIANFDYRREMNRMPKLEKTEEQLEQHEEVDLRGTFVSVCVIGAFILLSWLGVWYIFISR